MKDQFINLMQNLSTVLTGFGIHVEYNETTSEEREFYDVLMFVYELMARTKLIQSIEVPVPAEYIEPGDDLQPGDMVRAYNITSDALADFAFALTVNKGKVDMRAMMQQKIYQFGNTVTVEKLTGFHKTNLSDYMNAKREMNTGTWEMIMNALIEYKNEKA